jgi:hypothetical protein
MGVDCGDVCSIGCPVGSVCRSNQDCLKGSCFENVCISCTDGVKNGFESDIDCGISCGAYCMVGQSCSVDAACLTGETRSVRWEVVNYLR